MKLASVKFEQTDSWFGCEYVPNNPRNILLYIPEDGVAEGHYENGKWIHHRWNCEVNPEAWREIPKYK